jgi:hypothetical protein
MIKIVAAIVLGLTLLVGAFLARDYFSPGASDPVFDESGEPMERYTSEEYGLSFSYPESYELSEHEGASAREHAIVLIRKEDLPLPEAGEGPPAITIIVYANNANPLTTEAWIRSFAASNFNLSQEQRLSTVTIDEKSALSFRWSGLYEGTTIAIARPEWIYTFNVTYREPGEDIVQDFVTVRESVSIR